jgi:diaminopimelate epimerase
MDVEKWHGNGNDFLIVREADVPAGGLADDAVVAICDRHFGVGADGILVLGPSSETGADARMLIHNADGSMAEMCGNGIRVAAKYLVQHGMVQPGEDGTFGIETAGGLMRPALLADGRVRVDMGVLTTEGVVDVDLATVDADLAGSSLTGRIVSAGNPHYVIRRAPEGPSLHRLGPLAERHPRFPNRTNVEFWDIDDHERGLVRMRVWERGVGETLACGTGACAVAFTARTDADLTTDIITVRLPGGDLDIEFDGDRAFMTGAAHLAWAGSVDSATVLAGTPAALAGAPH